jgi:hypothetical protein
MSVPLMLAKIAVAAEAGTDTITPQMTRVFLAQSRRVVNGHDCFVLAPIAP